jgi:hypothetical protein
MLHCVVLVRTDVSEEQNSSIIGVTRVLVFLPCVIRFLVTANVPSSPILVTLMMEELRYYHEPHGATSQKTAFFRVTAVKTSNLT